MNGLFFDLLNNAIIVGWMIILVVIIRGITPEVSKRFRRYLWLLVAVRMLILVYPESSLSLVPNSSTLVITDTEQTSDDASTPKENKTQIQLQAVNNDLLSGEVWTVSRETKFTGGEWEAILIIVWISGCLVVLLWFAVQAWKTNRIVREAVPDSSDKRVRISDSIPSSFVWGIFRTHIYLKNAFSDEEKQIILNHEKIHLKCKDHLWKLLAAILLAIYWFQPLVWIGFILFGRDLEYDCDERLARLLTAEERKQYCRLLLNVGEGKKKVISLSATFAEDNIRSRVKNILKEKKYRIYSGILAGFLVVALGVSFLTNPDMARKSGWKEHTVDLKETVLAENEKACITARELRYEKEHVWLTLILNNKSKASLIFNGGNYSHSVKAVNDYMIDLGVLHEEVAAGEEKVVDVALNGEMLRFYSIDSIQEIIMSFSIHTVKGKILLSSDLISLTVDSPKREKEELSSILTKKKLEKVNAFTYLKMNGDENNIDKADVRVDILSSDLAKIQGIHLKNAYLVKDYNGHEQLMLELVNETSKTLCVAITRISIDQTVVYDTGIIYRYKEVLPGKNKLVAMILNEMMKTAGLPNNTLKNAGTVEVNFVVLNENGDVIGEEVVSILKQ